MAKKLVPVFQNNNIAPGDRVIWRPELCNLLGVGSECVRRWQRDGRLPEPDIHISARTKAWRLSTLQAHGIGVL